LLSFCLGTNVEYGDRSQKSKSKSKSNHRAAAVGPEAV
jgi:hypothetical protein